VGALAREVFIAALDGVRAIVRGWAELDATDTVPEDWTNNPNR
jgi:hypothetical protein